jgi:hypothetical protein
MTDTLSDPFLIGLAVGAGGVLFGFAIGAIGSVLGHRAGARQIKHLRTIDDETHGDVPSVDPWRDR